MEAQKVWWEQVNGIAPKQAPNSDTKINELESKLDNMANLVTNLVEQLGGSHD